MPNYNHGRKEINFKIVYCGPGMAGKTTNLQYLFSHLDESRHGKLMSIDTANDRTLFCDFLPVSVAKVQGYTVRVHLYTVPGQVRYRETRKIVLRGADAVVFVATSDPSQRESNIVSFEDMLDSLRHNHIDLEKIPIVLQYNKRDLPDILSVEEMNLDLNERGYRFKQAVASQGVGVMDTLELVTNMLIEQTLGEFKAAHQAIASVKAPPAPRPASAAPQPEMKKEPWREEGWGAFRREQPFQPKPKTTTVVPPTLPRIPDELASRELSGTRRQGPLHTQATPGAGTRAPLRRLPSPGTGTAGPLRSITTPGAGTAGPLKGVPTPGTGTAGPLKRVLTPFPSSSDLLHRVPTPGGVVPGSPRKIGTQPVRNGGPLQKLPSSPAEGIHGPLKNAPTVRTTVPLEKIPSPTERARGPLEDAPTPVSKVEGPLDDVPTPVS